MRIQAAIAHLKSKFSPRTNSTKTPIKETKKPLRAQVSVEDVKSKFEVGKHNMIWISKPK